jgi:CAAX protease family protein
MKNKPLFSYFIILLLLCSGFVIAARMLGKSGMYLAGGYMLTPAIAALVTRLFFYTSRFKDAGLRFGRLPDYLRIWLYSLAITALSYGMYTLFGSVRWDLSGKVFLDLLAQQFAAAGLNMAASLPPGFTPQMMLWLFFIGGLTLFNLMPGIVTGFGEEFGHRGFMFPRLYPEKPWLGLLLGGMLWYLWHQPLLLILPPAAPIPFWQIVVNHIGTMVGSVCTHTYLCYVYAKSRSIFVPSIAHIALDNAARSLSYFIILQDQFTANLALNLTMAIVLAILYYTRELKCLVGPFAHSGNVE